jgi:hypothetical protein
MIGKVSRSISRPRLNGGIVSEWRHRDRHALIGKRKEIIRHAPAFASDHDRLSDQGKLRRDGTSGNDHRSLL